MITWRELKTKRAVADALHKERLRIRRNIRHVWRNVFLDLKTLLATTYKPRKPRHGR